MAGGTVNPTAPALLAAHWENAAVDHASTGLHLAEYPLKNFLCAASTSWRSGFDKAPGRRFFKNPMLLSFHRSRRDYRIASYYRALVIIAMRNAGHSLRTIAEHHWISIARVRQILWRGARPVHLKIPGVEP